MYSTDKEPMLCSPNSHQAEQNKDTFTYLLEFFQQQLDHGMKKILHVKNAKPVNLYIGPILSSQTSCMASKCIVNQKRPASGLCSRPTDSCSSPKVTALHRITALTKQYTIFNKCPSD